MSKDKKPPPDPVPTPAGRINVAQGYRSPDVEDGRADPAALPPWDWWTKINGRPGAVPRWKDPKVDVPPNAMIPRPDPRLTGTLPVDPRPVQYPPLVDNWAPQWLGPHVPPPRATFRVGPAPDMATPPWEPKKKP